VGGYVVQAGIEGTEAPGLVRVRIELHHEQEGSAMEATLNVRDNQTLVLGSTRTYQGAALILIMRTSFR